MATKVIDFSSLNPVDSDIIHNVYVWQDWDTVNSGSGIYKANCLRVLERVTTGNSVTVTYDSDTQSAVWNYNPVWNTYKIDSDAPDRPVFVIDTFTPNVSIDSDTATYYFKI